MATELTGTSPSWLNQAGQCRWLRAHISTFCIGAVLLACANLLVGGSNLWSLTAIGIWIMLLVVHLVTLAIARLSTVLMAEDDEEIVLLPIKDALIVERKPDPTVTWAGAEPPSAENADPPASEKIPWTVATDVAQVRRSSSGEPSA